MLSLKPEDNIILIGMPGVGKSTIGVLLAKTLMRNFMDTDVVIQSHECRGLQDIIDDLGVNTFRTLEERYVLTIDCRSTVIATGGSVPYSAPAMEYLRDSGPVILLDVPLAELKRRLTNLATRGVVMGPSQTLDTLYEERMPLYRRYADLTLDCSGLGHEEVLRAICSSLATDLIRR